MPQEQAGLEIPRSSLDNYLSLIKKIMSIVPTELIFNLDETSMGDAPGDRHMEP
jgi:hypothetical protein